MLQFSFLAAGGNHLAARLQQLLLQPPELLGQLPHLALCAVQLAVQLRDLALGCELRRSCLPPGGRK